MKPVSTKKDNKSALTGRTLAQIAEAQDAVWHNNRDDVLAQKGRQVDEQLVVRINKSELDQLPRTEPAFIEPMQAKLVEKLPESEAWDYEAFLQI
ncbi:MAG TPA: hypothetical protein VHZ55_34565 [Bryobacteraceae bacterium]|jgi:N-acyl-D-aspartate/D-glutamate deacylase|nr:hypothetical protein [Bryobacteraceae bacterium]